MGMVKVQWEFLQDVVKLLTKAKELKFIVTGGELYRPIEMQKFYIANGRSKTMKSSHLDRLAIDFNFFIIDENGYMRLTWDRNIIRPLGDYWESLNKSNRWGGNWRGLIDKGKSTFVDVPHFERKL